MSKERIPPELAPQGASNRKFGLVVGGVLLAIAALRAYLQSEIGLVATVLGTLGFGLVALALIWPPLLTPANKAWALLGHALHKITNPIILGLIYVFAIIPTGLAMRAFGIDSLGLRSDRRNTYWDKRTSPGSTEQSLERPF